MTESAPQRTKLIYNIINRSAKKIATLVKIANLDYEIQQSHNESTGPHILNTPNGELHKQYQIINYIINQSREQSKRKSVTAPVQVQKVSEPESAQESARQIQEVKIQGVVNLEAEDNYTTAKMHQKLYELRTTLFPLLHQFYTYLTGFQKTKKSKYDSLMSKIKKEIGNLNTDISQNIEIFHSEFNFLNIIIACQIQMACRFVFEENFRKYKYWLFNKYQKISHRKQFIEVHGKFDLCSKQYVPSEFEEDGPVQNIGKQSLIPTDILKMSNNILAAQPNPNRNQLLYNYFKITFSKSQSKRQYYPYFWLMFDGLDCSLVQIVQSLDITSENKGTLKLEDLYQKINGEVSTQIDYGVLGLYQLEKDKKWVIRGLICLGSKSYEQFKSRIQRFKFPQLKIHKVDVTNQKQKKQVQNLWEHVVVNTVQQKANLNMIMHI